MPLGWLSENTTDPRPTNFFNQYGGRRTATFGTRGFIALRDVIDFTDIERFPTTEYGPIVAGVTQGAFDRAQQKIKDSAMPALQKFWLTTQNVARYINPSRVNAITNEMAAIGAMYNITGDQYHNDFGISVTKNYCKFITQVAPNATSVGRYRVGPDADMYGRYAREFKITRGEGEMHFKLNEELLNLGGSRFQLEVTVTYFDAGNGVWKILAGDNGDLKKKVTNTGTDEWKRITITFNDFVPGTLLDGAADIGLKYISGDNTAFTLIEVVNLDKERILSDGLPITDTNPQDNKNIVSTPQPKDANTVVQARK